MSDVTGRNQDIEVLRAIAVTMVLVHHLTRLLEPWGVQSLASVQQWLVGGHGVDLFFAISGFVIARRLLPDLYAARDRGEGFLREAGSFWLRRAFRLLPSAWLCLAFIVSASVLFNRTGAFGSVAANLWGAGAAFVQLANLYFPFHYGSTRGLGATNHFWSLSLEEQFYLMLPLLALCGRRALPWLAGGLALVQLLSTRPTFFHWMFRTDAMLLGVLVAIWSATDSHARQEPRWITGHRLGASLLCALLCIIVLVANAPRVQALGHGLSVVSMASALLVLMVSWDRSLLVGGGLLGRAQLWVGSRSYALYLWHVPVYALTREIMLRLAGQPRGLLGSAEPLVLVCMAIVLLALFSEASHRFVEAPLRRRGVALSERLAGAR